MPIMISVSLAPVSYFFCANAPWLATTVNAATAASRDNVLVVIDSIPWLPLFEVTLRNRLGHDASRTRSAREAVEKVWRRVGVWILPVALRGSASTKRIRRGHLKRARLAAQCARISASLRTLPDLIAMMARPVSPHWGSGMPI